MKALENIRSSFGLEVWLWMVIQSHTPLLALTFFYTTVLRKTVEFRGISTSFSRVSEIQEKVVEKPRNSIVFPRTVVQKNVNSRGYVTV